VTLVGWRVGAGVGGRQQCWVWLDFDLGRF